MKSENTSRLHPQVAQLLAFWFAAKGTAILPHRRFLEPLGLRKWINNLSIVEYRDGPKRYYVRLQSEDIADRIGQSLNRTYLEDTLAVNSLPTALAPYMKARETRLPTHSIMTPRLYPGLFSNLERLVLPFTDDDEIGPDAQVDRFLTWVGPSDQASGEFEPVYDLIPQEIGGDLTQALKLSIIAA